MSIHISSVQESRRCRCLLLFLVCVDPGKFAEVQPYIFGCMFKYMFISVCFEGVVCAILCLGIFENWSNFETEIYQNVDKIKSMEPLRSPTSVQGGTPQRFRKQIANKKEQETK